MKRLSARMEFALRELAATAAPISSYELRSPMRTLEALEERGLAAADRRAVGCIAFPATSVLWRITRSGRDALK